MKTTKYIFITGGVVSSLGKGITAASLGRLLKNRGLNVSIQKFDPYLNVDPGTMSPYQHELVRPLEFMGKTRVKQVKFIEMELSGFDSDGRKKPYDIQGSEFIFDVDLVIPAVSQYSDLPFVRKDEVEATPMPWTKPIWIWPDMTFQNGNTQKRSEMRHASHSKMAEGSLPKSR